jgi:hypothetical protein
MNDIGQVGFYRACLTVHGYAGWTGFLEGICLPGRYLCGELNRLNRRGRSTTVVTREVAVINVNMGLTVYIQAEANLKLCVFYFRHCMMVTHTPTLVLIDLDLVRGFCDQMKWEENFNNNAAGPVINDKDCSKTLESIRE